MSLYQRLKTFVSERPALNRPYLVLRQQYRHVEAGLAALASAMNGRGASTRFILFGRGRSGTTALVSLLDGLPSVRCEGEILHDWVPFPHLHVRGRSARAASRTYGCKILSYQIRDVQWTLPSRREFLHTLHHEDGFQVLYLRRTNLLRHALSNIRARRDTFHQEKDGAGGSGGQRSEREALHVDPETVVDWMRSSEALRTYEETLLDGVPHLSLTYEDHIRNPDQHQATIDDICEFLDVESAPVQSRYQKIAPPSLRDGVENYDQLVRRLQGTRYEEYLD